MPRHIHKTYQEWKDFEHPVIYQSGYGNITITSDNPELVKHFGEVSILGRRCCAKWKTGNDICSCNLVKFPESLNVNK